MVTPRETQQRTSTALLAAGRAARLLFFVVVLCRFDTSYTLFGFLLVSCWFLVGFFLVSFWFLVGFFLSLFFSSFVFVFLVLVLLLFSFSLGATPSVALQTSVVLLEKKLKAKIQVVQRLLRKRHVCTLCEMCALCDLCALCEMCALCGSLGLVWFRVVVLVTHFAFFFFPHTSVVVCCWFPCLVA